MCCGESDRTAAAAAAAAVDNDCFDDDADVFPDDRYGNPSINSANVDKLANEGVRFTAWYSGFHVCSPSRAAMLTGRLCVRSGTCGSSWLGGVFGSTPVAGLPTNETTFAQAVKSQGYTTAAMGKWHLGTKDEYVFIVCCVLGVCCVPPTHTTTAATSNNNHLHHRHQEQTRATRR